MSKDKPRIGFIGLGIMGRPMAFNLLKNGYEVSIYNRTESKVAPFVEKGAKQSLSPAEVARVSDVVITMLGDSSDVEQIILGKCGVIEGGQPGLIVIDMGTISPKTTKEIAVCLKEKGMEMLDAPVSGGEKGAIEGTLTIMVGGNKEIFEECIPVFEAMGKRINYFGGTGMGQTTKLGNQIMCSLTLMGISEGLLFASKAGLDLERFIGALSGGMAQSALLTVFGPKISKRDFEPGFMVKHEQKDLRLVLEAAHELNLSLPGIGLVQQMYNAVEAEDNGETLGHHSLVKALEKLAGYRIGE